MNIFEEVADEGHVDEDESIIVPQEPKPEAQQQKQKSVDHQELKSDKKREPIQLSDEDMLRLRNDILGELSEKLEKNYATQKDVAYLKGVLNNLGINVDTLFSEVDENSVFIAEHHKYIGCLYGNEDDC